MKQAVPIAKTAAKAMSMRMFFFIPVLSTIPEASGRRIFPGQYTARVFSDSSRCGDASTVRQASVKYGSSSAHNPMPAASVCNWVRDRTPELPHTEPRRHGGSAGSRAEQCRGTGSPGLSSAATGRRAMWSTAGSESATTLWIGAGHVEEPSRWSVPLLIDADRPPRSRRR